MSKEDRYAHLGDGIEETTDAAGGEAGTTDTADDTDPGETAGRAATAAESAQLTVTLDDGDEETVLRFDAEEVSADDLRAAIESAPKEDDSRDPLVSGDPDRLAFELGTLGPRLALRSVESIVDGMTIDRRRDRD